MAGPPAFPTPGPGWPGLRQAARGHSEALSPGVGQTRVVDLGAAGNAFPEPGCLAQIQEHGRSPSGGQAWPTVGSAGIGFLPPDAVTPSVMKISDEKALSRATGRSGRGAGAGSPAAITAVGLRTRERSKHVSALCPVSASGHGAAALPGAPHLCEQPPEGRGGGLRPGAASLSHGHRGGLRPFLLYLSAEV